MASNTKQPELVATLEQLSLKSKDIPTTHITGTGRTKHCTKEPLLAKVMPRHLPISKRLSSTKIKPLVLLDVNNLLCCKIDKDVSSADLELEYKLIHNNKYDTVVRPNLSKLFDHLLTSCRVAIFSSTTKYNLNKILPEALGKYESRLSFIADRSYTTLDPDYGKNTQIESHDTVKYLSTIWNNPCFTYHRLNNSSNTLLVDNDEQKTRFNPLANILIVESWDLKSLQTIDDLIYEIDEALAKLPLNDKSVHD